MRFVIFLILIFNVSSSWALDDVIGTLKLREINESPNQLLHRLDSLENSGAQPLYKINFLRSYAYYSMSRYSVAYDYALSVIMDDNIRNDESVYKRTIILLSENAINSYRIHEASDIVSDGLKYAEKHNDELLTANMLFMEALIHRRINNLDKCYEYFNRSIQIFSKQSGTGSMLRLSQILGLFCDVYIYDKKYEEAWTEARNREKILSYLRTEGECLMLVDRQEANLYSRLAYLSHKQGRRLLAHEYYNKFLSTSYSTSMLGMLDINDYLLETGNYQAVIDNCKKFFLDVDVDDAVSVVYQRALRQSAAAYKGIGDYKWAYSSLERLTDIRDKHRLSINRQFVLERENIEKLKLYQQDIQDMEDDLSRNHKIMVFFIVVSALLFVVLALIVWVIYNYKRLKLKNRTISSLLMELVEARRTENNTDDKAAGVSQDYKLFLRFDEKVRNEKLFLIYQMQRDDFAQIMGVDRNKFAYIIKEYTGGGNLNSYLNDMRLEYSVYLLKNHPEMSIQEVGKASALPSSATFYRLFKEKYDISPNNFREQLNS